MRNPHRPMRRIVSDLHPLPLGFAIVLAVLSQVAGIAQAAPPKSREAKNESYSAEAAAMLHQALEAESTGNSNLRAELLTQVLDRWPDYTLAQWQAGRINVAGTWFSVADAERQAGSDSLQLEYEQLRRKTPNTLKGHQSLALWCRKHKLNAEARSHWRNVLNFAPLDSAALRALALQWHQGALLTTEEIAEQTAQTEAIVKANAHWHEKVFYWRHDLVMGSETQRAEALSGILSIDDVNVIPLIEKLMTHRSLDNRGPAFGMAVAQLYGKLHDWRATDALLRLVVLSDWAEIRAAAAAQLAKRDATDYVPNALGAVQLPWQLGPYNVYVNNAGTVVFQLKLIRESADYYDFRLFEKNFVPVSRKSIEQAQMSCLRNAFDMAARRAEIVERENAIVQVHNERIYELIRTNFGEDQGSEPEAWWSWWKAYNELHDSGFKPICCTQTLVTKYVRCSCFAGGTLISTKTGQTPIEEIQPGTLVLAQNPQTGELAYKPVTATTTRPPSPLRKFTIENETIATTRGHRFWQEGRGWRMAKQIDAGVYLRGLDGPLLLDAAEDAEVAKAYNLVVEDFHTYFVGNQRILVHDNSAPRPVLGRTPGLIEADDEIAP